MPERTGPVPLKDCIDELLLELLVRAHRAAAMPQQEAVDG